jgi:hypothetical protein
MFDASAVNVTAHSTVLGAVTFVEDEEPQLVVSRRLAAAANDRTSATMRGMTLSTRGYQVVYMRHK